MSLRKRQEIQEVLRHRKLIAAPLLAAALLVLTVGAASAWATDGAESQATAPNPLQPRTQRAGTEPTPQTSTGRPGATLNGAVWPAKWGEHTRAKVQPVAISDAGLWAEYEGEAAEKVSFKSPIGLFGATAWRLRDATSALAWY